MAKKIEMNRDAALGSHYGHTSDAEFQRRGSLLALMDFLGKFLLDAERCPKADHFKKID